MRKVFLLSFVFGLAFSFTSCDILGIEDLNPNRIDISISDLPNTVMNYIAAYYPDDTVEGAATNLTDESVMFYEVFMSSGKELEFDLEGTFLQEDEEDKCGRDRKGGRHGGEG